MKTPVLIVFGQQLELVAADGSRTMAVPDGVDLTAATVQLLTETGNPPRSLNLLYHPHDLTALCAECANLNRAKLRKFFASEHRTLANPITPWAATKPTAHLDGKYSTILHYENRSRIDTLIQAIETAGAAVRVILPPAAALAAQTRANSLEAAVLAAGDTFLFYHVNELQIPALRFTRSPEMLIEEIGNALSARKNTPAGFLVVANDVPAALTATLASHKLDDKVTVASWAEFAGDVDFLPTDPANFAQRPFKWRLPHTLKATAALLACLATYLAVDYGRDRATAAATEHDRTVRRDALQAEVAALQHDEATFQDSAALLALVTLENPRPSALLDAITADLPPTLSLRSFLYQAGTFTLSGVAYEGAGQDHGPLNAFTSTLARSRAWTLKSPAPTTDGATWTVTGEFSQQP